MGGGGGVFMDRREFLYQEYVNAIELASSKEKRRLHHQKSGENRGKNPSTTRSKSGGEETEKVILLKGVGWGPSPVLVTIRSHK